MSEFAGLMKQEANLFSVVQDNMEAPHKINITESPVWVTLLCLWGMSNTNGTAALRAEHAQLGSAL